MNAKLGSIGNAAAVGNTIALNITAVTLELTGTATAGGLVVRANDYSGLGTVTLSDDATSEVDINTAGATLFANDFAVTNGGVGIFTIKNGSNMNTFSGNIGVDGTEFEKIQIQDNATFKGANMAATNIKISDNGVMTLDSTTNPIIISGPIDSFAVGDLGSLSTMGANNITFHDSIGATEELTNVTIVGDAVAKPTITFTNSIAATTNVTHQDITLAVPNNLAITAPGRYTLQDAVVNAGDKTIAVTAGAVTLANNITINATFTGGNQTVLNLNGTPANNMGVNLTFNLIQGAAPADGDSITMITGLTNAVGAQALPANWAVDAADHGKIVFRQPAPAVVRHQAAMAQAEKETGTTDAEIDNNMRLITALGGSGLKTSDGTIPGAVAGQKVLSIYDPSTADLSTSDGIQAFFDRIDDKPGFVAAVYTYIMDADNVYIEPEQAAAYALVAKKANLMRPIMADAISNAEASGISQSLAQEALSVGPQKAFEMSDRITNSAQKASSVTFDTIGARTAFVTLPTLTFSPVPAAGPGAGDLRTEEGEGIGAGNKYDQFGTWVSVNAGIGKQKQLKSNDGFRSKSRSIVFGADTLVNDRMTVGFAISRTMNNIKHRNVSLGNKTDASSWVGLLYANRQLKNNWFIRGSALFNRTHINSKELRVIGSGYGLAQAKYNLISYGAEANVGFSRKIQNDIIVTPTIGARILHNNKIRFNQDGTTGQNNKDFSQSSMDNYYALAGLSLAKTIVKNDITYTPEIHANFQYDIKAKAPTGSFISPLTPNSRTEFTGARASRFNSSYGISLTGSYDSMEAGISGDVNLASKYVGYQGSLKLKLKF